MSETTLRFKISIGIMIAGAVFLLFGMLLIHSGNPSSYFDFKSYEYSAQSADIKSVELNIGYGNVNITTGTSFRLKCENAAEELFEYKISNNILLISYKADFIESTYLGMGDGVETTFDIMLPNKLLEEVNITLDSGTLSAKGVSCNDFVCNAKRGDVSLSGITANHSAKISGGSGDTEISGCTFSSLRLTGGFGHINAIRSRFTNMKYEGGFGSIKLAACTLSGDSRLDTGFSKTEILLPGSEQGYGFSFEKGAGEITVDGSDDYKKYDDTISAGDNLFIRNGFGSVSISFGVAA